MGIPRDVIPRLRTIVGGAGVVTDAADMPAYLRDWRGNYFGKACCIVRPSCVAEVSQVIKFCVAERIPIVAQGGNTGLVGGAIPDDTGNAIVLSTRRMNRIRGVDTANNTLAADAGCILADIQAAADAHDRLFPLSLAAEGSCTIGGNLSTNAGGVAVLRYGNTRDLVLGLEAVLPNGEIWDGMRALRKDNTGYDLKQLLVGAEGTLGVITAVILKLFPRPRSTCTALVAVPTPAAAIGLLAVVQGALGDRVTGFELISRICVDHVVQHFPATVAPFAQPQPWQVLVELTDTLATMPLDEHFAAALETPLANGIALDAVIASSSAQAQALWKIREDIPEAEKREGKSVKHDISLPISKVAEFIARCDTVLESAFPDAAIICFGHLGDGNLHYNLAFPGGAPTADQVHAANRIVYALLDELGGSISAEHGLGQLKRDEILLHKSRVEMDAMRAIKQALDPYNIMNPGKVL